MTSLSRRSGTSARFRDCGRVRATHWRKETFTDPWRPLWPQHLAKEETTTLKVAMRLSFVAISLRQDVST